MAESSSIKVEDPEAQETGISGEEYHVPVETTLLANKWKSPKKYPISKCWLCCRALKTGFCIFLFVWLKSIIA